ncbi:MAG: hypothetical protein NWP80_02220 [Candidatus Gracilibacteria bacterium]|nr:hypothetical protein [Candidatus Gracilibacteria bacterium]
MKKIILFIQIFLFFLINPNITLGFLGSFGSIDLYETIDKGNYELKEKMLELELLDGLDGIDFYEKINIEAERLGLQACFSDNIIPEDILNLEKGDVGALHYKLAIECPNLENINIGNLSKYSNIGLKFLNEARKSIESRTNFMINTSNVGLFSDGNKENSPFDLLVDLEEINEILFEKKLEYNGGNTINLENKLLEKITKSKEKKSNINNGKSNNITITNGQLKEIINNDLFLKNKNSLCFIDKNNLENKSITQDLYDLINQSVNNNDFISEIENEIIEKGNDFDSGFKSIDDKNFWPCEEKYCIKVDFIIKNYDLFIGGKNYSLEGLFKRSNNHLKKFAFSSLIQSKMTINNFELGFKNFNLFDTFHVGFQITKKPAPIINLNKSNSNNSFGDELLSKNLLNNYYSNLGLDFNRSNDINLFNSYDKEIKTGLDVEGSNIINFLEKYNDYEKIVNKGILENEYLSKDSISRKLSIDNNSKTLNLFTEIESFINNIYDYSKDLDIIIRGMNEIPNS